MSTPPLPLALIANRDERYDRAVSGGEAGTRSSTVRVMARDGHVRFDERSFDAGGAGTGRTLEEWNMDTRGVVRQRGGLISCPR